MAEFSILQLQDGGPVSLLGVHWAPLSAPSGHLPSLSCSPLHLTSPTVYRTLLVLQIAALLYCQLERTHRDWTRPTSAIPLSMAPTNNLTTGVAIVLGIRRVHTVGRDLTEISGFCLPQTPNWKQPRCASTGEWINKLRCVAIPQKTHSPSKAQIIHIHSNTDESQKLGAERSIKSTHCMIPLV